MEGEPEDGVTRPTNVTETLLANGGIVSGAFMASSAARAAGPAGPPARGDRAALLRGPVRGRDRRRDGDQPRRGQEPHRPRHVRPARGPGARVMTRSGFDGPPPQGPDPMDFGDYLRRAMHAAADQ